MFLEILEGQPIPQEQKDIDENDEPREPLLSYTFFWGGGGLTVTYTLSVLHRIGGVPSAQFLNRLCCIEILSKVI